MFLIRGGYRRIRKCLRKRGWVELDYYRTSIKSTNKGGTTSPVKKPIETIRPRSRCANGDGSGDGDDSDGDTDGTGNDGGAVSEEEYSDEEEYCMLVNKKIQKLFMLVLDNSFSSLSLSLPISISLEQCVTVSLTLCGH